MKSFYFLKKFGLGQISKFMIIFKKKFYSLNQFNIIYGWFRLEFKINVGDDYFFMSGRRVDLIKIRFGLRMHGAYVCICHDYELICNSYYSIYMNNENFYLKLPYSTINWII